MTFTPVDKRLLERRDLAFQEKFLKDMSRHTPDVADKYEVLEIEHLPIGLYQKKISAARPAQALAEPSAEQAES